MHGRLVAVNKNAPLLDRPLDLWAAMFEVYGKLGDAVCPSGWISSLLRQDFADGVATLLAAMAGRGGTIGVDDAGEIVWSALVARYRMDNATEDQLRRWRQSTDRDLRYATALLVRFGALAEDEAHTLRLAPLADWALRRRFGIAGSDDPVAQIKVTLLDTDPPVWRRLLVSANLRLDRLHQVIQAAMGWYDYHLHMFIDETGRYGTPDLELRLRDERKTTLHDLAKNEGDRIGYEYDFGDSWEHEILLEKLVSAEPDGRRPNCVAGARACPPEDCGGTPGYEALIEVLADTSHREHEDMLQWLSLEKGTDFQPDRFDVDEVNQRLDAAMTAAYRTT